MQEISERQPTDFHKQLLKVLKARYQLSFNSDNSLPMLFLVQHYREQFEPDDATGRRSAINQLVDEAIGRLRTLDEDAANIIEWRFVDEKSVEELIDQSKGESRHVFMPKQRAALKQLATIIWDLEIAHRKEVRQQVSQTIPQRIHGQLVGIEELVETVTKHLLDEENSNPVIIHGIGGIGKTTLAETAVSQLVHQLAFTQVAWVTVQNSALSNGRLDLDSLIEPIIEKMGHTQWLTFDVKKQKQQLTYTLNNQPYLIVIDNNECPIDQSLIAQLNDWSGKSRFLITSRMTPPGGAGWSELSVNQLSLGNTAELIRAQAVNDSVESLASLTNDDIQPIYDAVGGNPQAIKLVVGLTRKRPLKAILKDIPKATSKKIEKLYTHIYWEAWRALSENGRSLLQLMFSADEMGYDAEDLEDFSTLAEGALWDSVDELMDRSLLNKSQDHENPLYSIHRLTASFLQTEIINWPDLPKA